MAVHYWSVVYLSSYTYYFLAQASQFPFFFFFEPFIFRSTDPDDTRIRILTKLEIMPSIVQTEIVYPRLSKILVWVDARAWGHRGRRDRGRALDRAEAGGNYPHYRAEAGGNYPHYSPLALQAALFSLKYLSSDFLDIFFYGRDDSSYEHFTRRW